jgi:glutathione synthase
MGMKLGILVNDVDTERPGYTTTRLALTAAGRGHEVWLMGAADLAYDPDESIHARARTTPKLQYRSTEAYLADLQGRGARRERIALAGLDVLLLRSNPAEEPPRRAWARNAGIDFGRIAVRHGVIVLNDPNGLASAQNKTYLQLFPDEVRARTLVSRDRDEIKGFIEELGGHAVLKPLQGSGGTRVFVVTPAQRGNTNQMIEALVRDGYAIAQEHLGEEDAGDTRIFLMNGRPLAAKGRLAAYRRFRSAEGARSFMHVDQTLVRAELSPAQLRAVDIARPKLVQDGMFLVAVDFVHDLLIDINVFSPGGLGSAQQLEKVNFSVPVVEAIERKVAYMGFYRRNFDNVEMATL